MIRERSLQLLRGILEDHEKITGLRERVARYARVEVGPLQTIEDLERTIRERLCGESLREFTIIPIESVTPADLEHLLSVRDRREERAHSEVPDGLHDTVILLSSIKYAQAKRLTPCIFVSHNTKDFSAHVVRRLGQKYGGDWRLMIETRETISFLQDPNLVAAATQFMRDNTALIWEQLERGPIWKDGRSVLGAEIVEIGAYADDQVPPRDGDIQLRFYAIARWPVNPPPPMRRSPGVHGEAVTYYYGDKLYPYGGAVYPPPWLPTAIEGIARATIKGRQFVGTPTILDVRLRGLEIRGPN